MPTPGPPRDIRQVEAIEAVLGQRDRVIVSTKTSLPMSDDPADAGSSRSRLIWAYEDALRRPGTCSSFHAYDAGTPIEEVSSTLDDLVRAGKVRYVGASNFSGWQLMKSLGVARQYGRAAYVAHEVYYSLAGRDDEWELMPLGLDQGVGALVWSPLGWVRLRQNLGATGWTLTPDQIRRLDAVTSTTAPYPYFPYHRQEGFARLNPPATWCDSCPAPFRPGVPEA